MQTLTRGIGRDPSNPVLPEEIEAILRAGWYTADCGALLLRKIGLHAKSWPCDVKTMGRHEYEVNDVKVPDSDIKGDRDRFLSEVVARAVHFARTALRAADGMPGSGKLVAVLSTGIDAEYRDHGTTVKFFTTRGDHPDWFDDLEKFKIEAMMILEMSDVAR